MTPKERLAQMSRAQVAAAAAKVAQGAFERVFASSDGRRQAWLETVRDETIANTTSDVLAQLLQYRGDVPEVVAEPPRRSPPRRSVDLTPEEAEALARTAYAPYREWKRNGSHAA